MLPRRKLRILLKDLRTGRYFVKSKVVYLQKHSRVHDWLNLFVVCMCMCFLITSCIFFLFLVECFRSRSSVWVAVPRTWCIMSLFRNLSTRVPILELSFEFVYSNWPFTEFFYSFTSSTVIIHFMYTRRLRLLLIWLYFNISPIRLLYYVNN